ncbi:MAG: hypothetical protein JWO38_2298 [Gemmataceae bacterium]|nr:hypothetical protein [Gemmataceae bacterium]
MWIFWALDRVAKQLQEDRLRESIQQGECGTALGPQRLRPVQHLSDPLLLSQ